MARSLARLALSGLSTHALGSLLTGVVVVTAAFTLALALAVGRIAEDPWQRTFEATNGAHVLASARDRTLLESLTREPGVAASAGPGPSVFTSFEREGRTIGVVAAAAGVRPPEIGRPLVVEGGWLRPGGVVLERSFARYFDLEPGDMVAIAGRAGPVTLRVAGVAVTATQERYPVAQPGLVFVLPEALERIEPDTSRWGWTVGLRLDRPETAPAFSRYAESLGRIGTDHWQEMRADATAGTRGNRIVLSTFAVFLLLASGFVIANHVGARVLARFREIGLLKAIGLTPAQVAGAFTLEYLLVGLVAAVVGVGAGIAAAPLFVGPSQGLVDVAGGSLGVLDVVLVLAVVEALVGLVAFVPTWRAARRSTMQALAGARPASRSSRLARAAVRLRLPMPVALGVKDAVARPSRAVLTSLSLLLTVVVVVAALSMEASYALEDRETAASIERLEPPLAAVGPPWDILDDQSAERAQLRLIVYGLSGVLLFVALANLLTTALLAVRERVRDLGILRAVGLTPRGVSAGVLTSSGLLGLAAVVVGVPLGLVVFRGVYALVNDGTEGAATPAWWQLAAVGPAVLLVVLAATGVPARRASRLPVADALRYE